jgi:thiamine-monophosphate kinase
VGHRAAVNLSDLAAMGAAPRLALLSLALPAAFPIADFDQMVSGLTALAARHRVHLAGGNLTRSPGPLVIDVTVVGTVKRRQALTRGGSRPGDELWVTGTIGAAAAGLQISEGRQRRCRGRAVHSAVSLPGTAPSHWLPARQKPRGDSVHGLERRVR